MINSRSYRLYQAFKYAVYTLLTINVGWFFSLEWSAATYRFGGSIPLEDIVDAFAATIDTASWVILLLMFELETWVLEDRHFTRRVTFLLHGLRIVCYGFIVYALSGYLSRLSDVSSLVPFASFPGICSLADGNWSYMIDLDQYLDISPDNCRELTAGETMYRMADAPVIASQAALTNSTRLAWLDVINASTWLAVVVLLEIDVWLQDRNRLHGHVLAASTACKLLFYTVLFCAAAYWGINDTFVNVWDAFLWLVAFFFIEMNIVEWRHEDEQAGVLVAPG